VHAKVDTEAEQQLAAAAQIRSIPTLMAFKKGKLVFNQPGALPPAALEDLVQQVKNFDIDAAIAAQEQDQA
jgi:thioredoxin reductase (NADPH)